MYSNDTRQKLQNIISGTFLAGQEDNCTAARNFLCERFITNTTTKTDFDCQSTIKEEQGFALKGFITANNMWLKTLPEESRYLAEGGEAKIYLHQDNKSVIKLNDAIYYATWLDFLNSILVHNLLFEKTAYELTGFTESKHGLTAILKQPFIISESTAELKDVKKLLEYNGFKNTRRNDYYNADLGLILEDIHDENVILNSEMLFFIDTVFYIHLKPADSPENRL